VNPSKPFHSLAPENLSSSGIEDKVKKGYLDRLNSRLRKMRKALSERDWKTLRFEAEHIRASAGTFGLPRLSVLAQALEDTIPPHEVPRAVLIPAARQAANELLSAIDVQLAQIK
jgi:HPt (histidine-containing phosphotransfer) domain-containing protein